MVLSSLVLVSCGGVAPEEGTVTRMTVDINPSVEFMVDDENKVVSVTALNDDGSILIVGEAFVGKTPEEAVELMISVASETGYLVKGNAEAGENTVKISVSGESKYAKELLSDVEAKAKKTLESLDVKGTVEKVDALNTEALRDLAKAASNYTEEELAEMDEEALYGVIAEARIETALLLTEEMRNVYNSAKEYEISFAEREEVAKIIGSLGGIYTITHNAYKTALETYGAAIAELEELRYELLVSPESEYQKSLTSLREAKIELLQKRTYTASLDVNGEEYASATVSLQLSEENYDKALKAYEMLGAEANAAIDALINTLKQSETALRNLEETLFDDNIESTLKEKAAEIEASVNLAKDEFFAEFEAEHAEDIASIEASLLAKKQELKSSIGEDAA